MSTNTALLQDRAAQPAKPWILWTGRALSTLPILMLLFSASMKLSHQPQFVEMFTKKFGFPEAALTPIGLLEILCVLLYAVPRTAALGALLLTGYLGGAIVTHLRIGEAFAPELVLGVLVWLGLYLREPRLRALLPVRQS